MSEMWALPRNPYERPRKITRLSDCPHKAQMASTALALEVPFTPVEDRATNCEAAKALDVQVAINFWLMPKGHQ